jgi:hypothetical protein
MIAVIKQDSEHIFVTEKRKAADVIDEDIDGLDMGELYSAQLQQDGPNLVINEVESIPVSEGDARTITIRQAAWRQPPRIFFVTGAVFAQ